MEALGAALVRLWLHEGYRRSFHEIRLYEEKSFSPGDGLFQIRLLFSRGMRRPSDNRRLDLADQASLGHDLTLRCNNFLKNEPFLHLSMTVKGANARSLTCRHLLFQNPLTLKWTQCCLRNSGKR